MIGRKKKRNDSASSKRVTMAIISIRDNSFVRSTDTDGDGYLRQGVYVNLYAATSVSLANGINVEMRARKITVTINAAVPYADDDYSYQRTAYIDAKKTVRMKKGWLRNGTLRIEVYADGRLEVSYKPLALSAQSLVSDFGQHLRGAYKVDSTEVIAASRHVKVKRDNAWLITYDGDLYYSDEAGMLNDFCEIEAKLMPDHILVL